jgi:hypothetical protein
VVNTSHTLDQHRDHSSRTSHKSSSGEHEPFCRKLSVLFNSTDNFIHLHGCFRPAERHNVRRLDGVERGVVVDHGVPLRAEEIGDCGLSVATISFGRARHSPSDRPRNSESGVLHIPFEHVMRLPDLKPEWTVSHIHPGMGVIK